MQNAQIVNNGFAPNVEDIVNLLTRFACNDILLLQR